MTITLLSCIQWITALRGTWTLNMLLTRQPFYQLNYQSINGVNRTRTDDTLYIRQLLCHLSYYPLINCSIRVPVSHRTTWLLWDLNSTLRQWKCRVITVRLRSRKWNARESNPPSSACKTDVTPLRPASHNMGCIGVEPISLDFQSSAVTGLAYSPHRL